eukprot:TRINITY_DN9915_c0_g1_i1.p2 TRINITY_DN9915_c0_g1~~TRINITY_DN9915_c0_g1_i1.p2  ORF type:complete len:156 (+),score=22.78 TRINITY_DN9915_c0_g1_i1:42-470(+)
MVRYQGVKKMASASRSKKLKRAPKAIDEIYDEINTPKWEEVRQRTRVKPLNEDLPGLGQYYCMQCARHFISVTALETHNKSKSHKRRVRDLRSKPYGVDLEEVLCKKIDNGPPLRRNIQVREEQEAAAREQAAAATNPTLVE